MSNDDRDISPQPWQKFLALIDPISAPFYSRLRFENSKLQGPFGGTMAAVLLYFIVACLLCYFVTTVDAHAYIDPGTGSILLQLIIGALAVGASFVAGFWGKIKSYLSRSAPEENTQNLTSERPSEPPSQK